MLTLMDLKSNVDITNFYDNHNNERKHVYDAQHTNIDKDMLTLCLFYSFL